MNKILKAAALLLVVLLSALMLTFLWYRSASQPQIHGELRVPGLKNAVDIVRDTEGVPHIYARSSDDAYFALGFVHGQDRLWQMEMNRRIAAGTMAEILGAGAVGADRFLRTLGVRRNAKEIFGNLDAATRTALDAYANGVNAFLSQRSGPLPPEFLITGAPAPAPWHPVDSIGWQTMMAWDLGGNWSQELLRMRLSQRLPLELINQFLPPYPGDPVVETRDYTRLYRELTGNVQQLSRLSEIAPPSMIEGMGSNNWVVSGALSVTGKPLLANDPHLGLSAPALWYFAHLSAPGLNVIGATLPGIPSVVLGRNDRVAWGFTNTGPDVQDLYIERINPGNARQYQTPDGWADFETHRETIKVKGQPDITLEVRATRHGPVISGALPILDNAPLDTQDYVIALAWTALQPDDRTLQAGVAFNRASNWTEFVDGARSFSSPQQNIVYADIDGNIGFIAPGRVPVRKAANDLKGLAPAPGWDARYDWDGFIPFNALPNRFNPSSQKIVTANEKITADDYPYFLTSEWALPYRADRINALLGATAKHDMQSFADIQKDHVSLAAQELLPLLRDTTPSTAQAKNALAALAKWDGTMAADSAEALIFNAWMREASRLMFADELGVELMNDYWQLRNVHQPMVDVLKNAGGRNRWCGDARAKISATPGACARLLAESLELALADLGRRYGTDMAVWRWGDAHMAHAEHRPFSRVTWLAPLFDIRIPTPGDTYTVNVGRYNLREDAAPFANRHAASLRALYDLDNPENSRFIHSTGQSGNLLSPLYRNYVQRWVAVDYIPMKMQRSAVEVNRLGVLTLTP